MFQKLSTRLHDLSVQLGIKREEIVDDTDLALGPKERIPIKGATGLMFIASDNPIVRELGAPTSGSMGLDELWRGHLKVSVYHSKQAWAEIDTDSNVPIYHRPDIPFQIRASFPPSSREAVLEYLRQELADAEKERRGPRIPQDFSRFFRRLRIVRR